MSTEATLSLGEATVRVTGEVLVRSKSSFEGKAKLQIGDDAWNALYEVSPEKPHLFLRLQDFKGGRPWELRFDRNAYGTSLGVRTPCNEMPELVLQMSTIGYSGGLHVLYFSASTPFGEYQARTETNKVFRGGKEWLVIEATIGLPELKKIRVTGELSLGTDSADLKVTCFDHKGNKWSAMAAGDWGAKTASARLDLNNKALAKADIGGAFLGRYEVRGKTTFYRPLTGERHHYRLDLAFENTSRKTLKALCQCRDGSVGVALDYFFRSARDLSLEARASFPFVGFAPRGFTVRVEDSLSVAAIVGRGFEAEKGLEIQRTQEGVKAAFHWEEWEINTNLQLDDVKGLTASVMKFGRDLGRASGTVDNAWWPVEFQVAIPDTVDLMLRRGVLGRVEFSSELSRHLQGISKVLLTPESIKIQRYCDNNGSLCYGASFSAEKENGSFGIRLERPQTPDLGLFFENFPGSHEVGPRRSLKVTKGEDTIFRSVESTSFQQLARELTIGNVKIHLVAPLSPWTAGALDETETEHRAFFRWGRPWAMEGLEAVLRRRESPHSAEGLFLLKRVETRGARERSVRATWNVEERSRSVGFAVAHPQEQYRAEAKVRHSVWISVLGSFLIISSKLCPDEG